MKKLILVLGLVLAAFAGAHAQDPSVSEGDRESDSLLVESRDTVLLKSYATRYNPRKALMYAAVVPGLGQIYNKKYWKLPLVYGGFTLLGIQISKYQDFYTDYKSKLFRNLEAGYEGDSEVYPGDRFTTSSYRSAVDQSRRLRDLMIVFTAAVYILQMVDAHVDAHLKEFDLNPKLQVSIEPTMEQNVLIGRVTGGSVIIRF